MFNDLTKSFSIEDVVLEDNELIQIKGGNAQAEVGCGKGCGVGCGRNCGNNCSGSCSATLTPAI
jgi:hypothetical protein